MYYMLQIYEVDIIELIEARWLCWNFILSRNGNKIFICFSIDIEK